MTFNLLYPAILVFLLMLIGIILTAIEFKQLQKKEPEDKDRSQ